MATVPSVPRRAGFFLGNFLSRLRISLDVQMLVISATETEALHPFIVHLRPMQAGFKGRAV